MRPSAETTLLYGSAGSVTVLVTCPEARSIADTVCANTRVTYSVLPSRRDRHAAREALAGDGRQRERSRAGDDAVGVVELLDVVLARAGRVEPRAVGMPGEAVPRVVERHRALHRPGRDVDDRERRPRQAVAGDDEVFRIGRLQQVERHVADPHVLAGRLNAPAVGEQGGAVGHAAGQRRPAAAPTGRECGACPTPRWPAAG